MRNVGFDNKCIILLQSNRIKKTLLYVLYMPFCPFYYEARFSLTSVVIPTKDCGRVNWNAFFWEWRY